MSRQCDLGYRCTGRIGQLLAGHQSAGGLLFVAGNGPYDPDTREVVGDTIEEQTDAHDAQHRGDPARCRDSTGRTS